MAGKTLGVRPPTPPRLSAWSSARLLHADARALAALQPPVHAALQVGHVRRLPLGHGRPEVVVGPEAGVLAGPDAARRHRREEGAAPEHAGLQQAAGGAQEQLHVLQGWVMSCVRVQVEG